MTPVITTINAMFPEDTFSIRVLVPAHLPEEYSLEIVRAVGFDGHSYGSPVDTNKLVTHAECQSDFSYRPGDTLRVGNLGQVDLAQH